jgi:hypothetical protein
VQWYLQANQVQLAIVHLDFLEFVWVIRWGGLWRCTTQPQLCNSICQRCRGWGSSGAAAAASRTRLLLPRHCHLLLLLLLLLSFARSLSLLPALRLLLAHAGVACKRLQLRWCESDLTSQAPMPQLPRSLAAQLPP